MHIIRKKVLSFLIGTITITALPFSSFALSSNITEAQKLRAAIEINKNTYHNKTSEQSTQKIILPVSRGFDQKDTCLCWSYAFFNMLETLYLINHPDENLELSRGTMQYINLKDRVDLKISQIEDHLDLKIYKGCWPEGGTAAAAWYLVKNYGALQFDDYHDIIPPESYLSVLNSIFIDSTPDQKREATKTLLPIYFDYEPPQQTFFHGQWLSKKQFGNLILPKENLVTYAVSRDDSEYIDKSPDQDARRGELNHFVPKGKIIKIIINSFKNNRPVAYANRTHLTMIYGIEFNQENNEIMKFYIKDSYPLPTYTYQADVKKTLDNLQQITVLE